ncbi:putative F-box domain, leucine-rich repeat domain, L domain-containing protein [Rosa chinensis]|uniref:Putative F-box domain, leucine-rich repeat domain, L domain-containing protein n=1 Tax=Rosa chinensis TaxID=74649 RepID=A0A2P6P3F1_ROSCH|nr:F-box/FBD/LRR-repeat protein At1g13570 [Rosa chinensis]PRQ16460.1 putative F-box domain, leucine-rich repeat domain, L domain-containing protein [Rosa chinensis]
MKRKVCQTSEIDDQNKSIKLESVDRISELSDDIISSILSLLPIKEAEATSILSSRWRYMWAFSTRNLYFDAEECLRAFPALSRELRDQKSLRYVDWVDHVVEQYRGSGIEQFRVCFRLNRRFASSIDKWIQFALEKRTQVLVLELLLLIDESSRKDSYTFPQKLLDLNYSNGCIGFESLKVLELRNVDVTDEVVQHFLSKCPVLERLSICYATNLVNFKAAGPSIALKHLVIKNCFALKSIEVCDTSGLVSFTFDGFGDEISLSLCNLPLLVRIDVSIHFCEFPLISGSFGRLSLSRSLPQLETLGLAIHSSYLDFKRFNDVFPIPTLLPNLKHLELAVLETDAHGLRKLYSFLKASPHLQRLVLQCEFSFNEQPFDESLQQAGECKHHNLKVVQVVGYRARKIIATCVNYLIENVLSLEKIVIDPRRPGFHYTGMGKRIEEVEEERKARDHAMHQLKKQVPSTIECLCNYVDLE